MYVDENVANDNGMEHDMVISSAHDSYEERLLVDSVVDSRFRETGKQNGDDTTQP
jgi:hypothetical protein